MVLALCYPVLESSLGVWPRICVSGWSGCESPLDLMSASLLVPVLRLDQLVGAHASRICRKARAPSRRSTTFSDQWQVQPAFFVAYGAELPVTPIGFVNRDNPLSRLHDAVKCP